MQHEPTASHNMLVSGHAGAIYSVKLPMQFAAETAGSVHSLQGQ